MRATRHDDGCHHEAVHASPDPHPIRRAGASDFALVLGLIEQFYRVDGHHFDDEHIGRALTPLLHGDTHGQVWLLGEPPLGYAIVTWGYSLESGGREALLDEIYVARQGVGLGSQLLEAVAEHARKAGAATMFLETEAHNERARRFYHQHGFTTEASIWLSRDLTT